MDEVIVKIDSNPGAIDANFEEVKAYLSAQLEEYRTAVFDDEGIKMAKKIVADLRKQQKALSGRISEVKKTYLQPFEEFKAKADELVKLYDEPIFFINDQVEGYAERMKEEKRKVITGIYDQIFASVEGFSLESIYNPKWENATYRKSEIEQDMREIKTEIEVALSTLLSFCSEACDKAIEIYKRERKLSDAIAYIHQFENQKREILAKEREKEEERIRQQEREKLLAEQNAEREKAEAIEKAKAETEAAILESMSAQIDDDSPKREVIYSIDLTESQKEALEIYLDSCGLEWEVLN